MIVALIQDRWAKDTLPILAQLEPFGEGLNIETREWVMADGRRLADLVNVICYLDALSLEEAKEKYPEYMI